MPFRLRRPGRPGPVPMPPPAVRLLAFPFAFFVLAASLGCSDAGDAPAVREARAPAAVATAAASRVRPPARRPA